MCESAWGKFPISRLARIVLFRQQAYVVAQRQQSLEQFPRVVYPSAKASSGAHHPEAACQKDAFARR